jgi:hypothetical protein
MPKRINGESRIGSPTLKASSEHQWQRRSPMPPRLLMPGIPASRALGWRFAGCLRPNAAHGRKTLPQQDSPGSGRVQTGRPIDVATPHLTCSDRSEYGLSDSDPLDGISAAEWLVQYENAACPCCRFSNEITNRLRLPSAIYAKPRRLCKRISVASFMRSEATVFSGCRLPESNERC